MLRTLRILGLSLSLIACSLTIVMWMRSYKQFDDGYLTPGGSVGVYSVHGLLTVVALAAGDPVGIHFSTMPVIDVPSAHFKAIGVDENSFIRLPSYRRKNAMRSEVVVPYWFLFAIFGVSAVLLGLRRSTRFNLRQFSLAVAAAATILAIGVVVSRIG